MRHGLRIAAVFFLIGLAACPVPSFAEGQTLRVAVYDLPPWKTFAQDGTPRGIDISFLEILAARMGLRLEYGRYPLTRSLYMLEHGDMDLMTGILRRPERETYLHFIEPPYKNYTHKAFYMRKGQETQLRKYTDLYGLTVGTRMGSSYFPKFDNDPKIRKAVIKTFDLSLRMIKAGRIDAMIHTEESGDYKIRQSGQDHFIAKAPYAYRKRQDVYFVLSRKSPLADRLDEFNAVMADLVREGVFERVKDEFMETSFPR